jgi:hypothetical protein
MNNNHGKTMHTGVMGTGVTGFLSVVQSVHSVPHSDRIQNICQAVFSSAGRQRQSFQISEKMEKLHYGRNTGISGM